MKENIYYLEPVRKKISTDFITPVSAYSIFKNDCYSFLLESAQKGRTGRYSIMGFAPRKIYEIQSDKVNIRSGFNSKYKNLETINTKEPLKLIGKVSGRYRIKGKKSIPGFSGGLVGYAGYEMIKEWEDIDFKNARNKDVEFNNKDIKDIEFKNKDIPEGIFMFTDEFIVFDHLYNTAEVIKLIGEKESRQEALKRIDEIIKKLNRRKMPVRTVPPVNKNINYISNFTEDEFVRSVKKTKKYIKEGEIIQGVLSQRFTADVKTDPFNYYRALRMINPSPYMFYLKMGDLKLCGASPEVMAKLTGRKAVVRPIAGTRRRSLYRDSDEEERLSRDLKSDKKEQAEHTMLVDLARNDLSRVCEPGTVKTLNLMSVEKFSHVMHMVTDVAGRLKKGKRSMDLFKAAFPAGTVSGAPKLRAIKIIDRLEPTCRGPYAGAVGYFSFDGNMDTAIIIRTMLITAKKIYIQAGAGIVADSVPEKEYTETINKAKALFEAVSMAEKLKEEEEKC